MFSFSSVRIGVPGFNFPTLEWWHIQFKSWSPKPHEQCWNWPRWKNPARTDVSPTHRSWEVSGEPAGQYLKPATIYEPNDVWIPVTCMVLSLLTIESRKFGFIIILKTTQWLTSQLEMYKLFVRTYIHLSCAVVNCEPDTCSFFNVAGTY